MCYYNLCGDIMNEMLQNMLIIYGCSEYDWLGFKITSENPLTCHHIKKYNEGGENIIPNIALLTLSAHRYLHSIEFFDMDIYNKVNSFLKELNTQRRYPNKEEYEMINDWLLQYETCYKKALRKQIELKSYDADLIKELIPGYSIYHPTNFRLNLQSGINLYDSRVVIDDDGRKHKMSKIKKKAKRC